MVTGSLVARIGRQRQQATRMEHELQFANSDVQWPCGCGEGHRLVTASARVARVRRWHGRPMHSLLEHVNRPELAVCRHGLTSVQSGLVEAFERARKHPWLLAKSDTDLEVSVHGPVGQAHGSHISGLVFGRVARWRGNCDGSRRRDTTLLERVQQVQMYKRIQERTESVRQDTINTSVLDIGNSSFVIYCSFFFLWLCLFVFVFPQDK